MAVKFGIWPRTDGPRRMPPRTSAMSCMSFTDLDDENQDRIGSIVYGWILAAQNTSLRNLGGACCIQRHGALLGVAIQVYYCMSQKASYSSQVSYIIHMKRLVGFAEEYG